MQKKKWLDQNIQTDIKYEEDIVTISAVIEAKMDHAWVRILKFAKGVISFPYYTPNATRVARTQVMMIVVNHFGFQETLNLRVHLLHSGTNSFANKEPTSDSCVSISKKDRPFSTFYNALFYGIERSPPLRQPEKTYGTHKEICHPIICIYVSLFFFNVADEIHNECHPK